MGDRGRQRAGAAVAKGAYRPGLGAAPGGGAPAGAGASALGPAAVMAPIQAVECGIERGGHRTSILRLLLRPVKEDILETTPGYWLTHKMRAIQATSLAATRRSP